MTKKPLFFYYLGNFLLNFFRYLFHLLLLRFLTPSAYGEFLSYLSLMYLLAIPTGTIASLVIKVVADFKGKKDSESINNFFYYLLQKTAPFGLAVGTLLIIFSTPLANLFKAHPLAFIVLGVSTFISLFQTIISSFLTAFQKFLTQTVIGFVNIFLTIIFSLFLIKIGLSATGAVLGQIVAGIIITLLTLYQIKDAVFPFTRVPHKVKIPLRKFTLYSFIYNLGSMSLMSMDILVVRIMFDTHVSGLYSSLSILGRMILFGLSPLVSLVLPMASLRYSQKQSSRPVFLKLGACILTLGLIGASIFTAFSNLLVTKLSGIQYLSISPLLSYFAFTMVAFALSQFILSYLMATSREQANYLYLLATLIQPLALYLLGHSLENVVKVNFYLHLLLLATLLIYLCLPRLSALKFTHGQTKPK